MQNSTNPVGDKRTAKPSSNLVLKNQIRSQDDQNGSKSKVKAIKCVCRKSWCANCGIRNAIKRFVERMLDWNWQHVRQVILTVDPELYENPEIALKTITRGKHIANAIRNLERTKGIKIIDWEWVLEWYRNGFPHWHVFILVGQAGKGGMIGADNIRQYWQSGRIIESYIRNEKHWEKITGYFQKHGYFNKKKAHQSRLPEWAREKTYTIRRIGGQAQKRNCKDTIYEKFLQKEERKENPEKVKIDELLTSLELGVWFKNAGNEEKKTEGEKLDECGCETDLYLGSGFTNYLGRVSIPYKEFRSLFDGEYIEDAGYMVELDHNQLNDLIMIIEPNEFDGS